MNQKKTFRELHKIKLIYYILSLVVLFFPIYTQHIPGREQTTSLYGFTVMAKEIGWLYYIATAVGLLTVFTPFLDKLQDFAVKIISVLNLGVTLFVYIPLIKDTIGGSFTSALGSTNLSAGFWLTILLHLIAVLGFWFSFYIRVSNKRKAKQEAKEQKEADIKDQEDEEELKQIAPNTYDAEFKEKEE